MKTNAPITPQRIICFLFFGTKFAAIEPDHVGINEYLGELYVATNRHNLAVERLEILKSCNCKEYDELKAVIAGEKVSKY